MKHSWKITLLLLTMFFVTQLIGLWVISQYAPHVIEVVDQNGTVTNTTVHDLPYGMEPPEDVTPVNTLFSFAIALAVAVSLMFILMRYNAELFIRLWFFFVVTMALGVTFSALLKLVPLIPYTPLIALVIAAPLAFLKVFKRNIIVHNLTELLIYPGVAAIFVPLLTHWAPSVNLIAASALLIGISLYDMYAVWHAGFMQKMAQYQIEKLRLFTGFFVPYVGKKERAMIARAKEAKKTDKKIKVNVAILGGGDVVFPMVFAGVVMLAFGLIPALMIAVGATLALAALFYFSEKGKFYPAMPFIAAGCFVGLGAIFLLMHVLL